MAGIWDLTVNLVSIFGNWIWDGLAAVGGSTVDIAQQTILAVVNFLVGIITLALYLPISMFGVVINLLNIILGSVAGLVNTVIGGGNTLVSSFLTPFSGTYPSAWVTILMSIIIINIVLRVYYFVKDIRIAGFGV